MKDGKNLTLSGLRSTVHLGAHADAPSHYSVDGASIAERDLNFYLGPCEVIGVDVGRVESIKPAHFSDLSETRILRLGETWLQLGREFHVSERLGYSWDLEFTSRRDVSTASHIC